MHGRRAFLPGLARGARQALAEGAAASLPFVFPMPFGTLSGSTPMLGRQGSEVMADADLVAQIEALEERLARARESVARRFIGQERVVDLTLGALLCGGHALLVGLPGLGKTRLVQTLATVMGLQGGPHPVHAGPDAGGYFGLRGARDGPGRGAQLPLPAGPIFCQLLMADEINRASPRTQSALLRPCRSAR
jgi:hypothetical protein